MHSATHHVVDGAAEEDARQHIDDEPDELVAAEGQQVQLQRERGTKERKRAQRSRHEKGSDEP